MRIAVSILLVVATSTVAMAQDAAAPPAEPADEPAAPVAAPAVAPPPPDPAQPNYDACLAGLKSLEPAFYEDGDTPEPCADLAQYVRVRLGPSAKHVEPLPTGTPGNQDSAGQAAAVASGEPVAQAAGTVGLSGTAGSGLQLVAALAVNPVGAAADPKDFKRYAWGSRAADVSVVVPVGLDGSSVAREGFQYLGVHVRLNVPWLLGGWRSAPLVNAAEQAFAAFLDASGTFIGDLERALAQASDPASCARAVIDGNETLQRVACGAVINGKVVAEGFGDVASSLEAARNDADRFYLTLEARGDWGDVNGDAAESDDSLLGVYASGGFHLGEPRARSVAFRARFGVASYRDGAMDTGVTVYHLAGGVDLGAVAALGRLSLSVGLEKQWTTGGSAVGTEFQNVRIGVTVPVADGKSVSLGVSLPAGGDGDEDREPAIVVNGDWASLFGP
jgi:hypothetical protein